MNAAMAPVLTCDSAGTPTGDPQPVATRHAWYSRQELRTAFGGGKLGRKRWLYFVGGLSAGQKRKRGDGAWEVRGDALLPESSRAGGKPVAEFVQELGCRRIPKAIKSAGHRARQSEVNGREVLRLDRRLQTETSLRPSTEAYFAELERVHGETIRALGFSPKRDAMIRLRRRAARGEPLSRSFRSGRKRQELFDAEIFEECTALALHPNQLKDAGVYGLYAFGQGKAGKLGKRWDGSKATFRRRLRAALPRPFRTLGQKGDWRFEAHCVPKLVRDRHRFGAGEAVSLDGRGGLRQARLMAVAIFDQVSGRMMRRYLGTSESADATFAAFADLRRRHGGLMPRRIGPDRSKAFNAFSDPRLPTLAKVLNIEIHQSPARYA